MIDNTEHKAEKIIQWLINKIADVMTIRQQWKMLCHNDDNDDDDDDDDDDDIMMTNLQNSDKVEIFRAARVYRLPARQDWPAIIIVMLIVIKQIVRILWR